MHVLYPTDAERELIGIILSKRDLSLSQLRELSPNDFSDETFRRLFAAIGDVAKSAGRLSLAGVDAACTRLYGADATRGLMDIAMSASREFQLNGWRLPAVIKTVRTAARRRQLERLGNALLRAVNDPGREVSEIADSARTALRDCVQSSGDWVTLNDAALDAYGTLDRQEKPIPTGIHELDGILCGGLHRGELTLLGARPAIGKSAVLLQIALSAAQSGHRVALVSLEMSSQQIGARVLAAHSGVNLGLLRTGEKPGKAVEDARWEKLADALTVTSARGGEAIKLLARGGMCVEDLRAEAQSCVDDGCDLLLLDYAQLLTTRKRTASEYEKLSAVSRALKALTLDLGIPVVAAAQVNRNSAQGVGLRAPTLAELRGSGSLEQDGDNVILLHRIESHDDSALSGKSYKDRYPGLLEKVQGRNWQLLTFDVAKQRQGATARAWCVFDSAHMRFIEPEVFKCS